MQFARMCFTAGLLLWLFSGAVHYFGLTLIGFDAWYAFPLFISGALLILGGPIAIEELIRRKGE